MAHKKRMTVADILLSLRQQLLAAQAGKNKDDLKRLESYFDILWEIAAQVHDPKAIGLLDDLTYAASHFVRDVDFKALDALPSVEAIEKLESAAATYEIVRSKLVRRVVVRKELHSLDLGFDGVTQEKIEPDWIGIAFVQGPYQDTFDSLYYKSNGSLISWQEFDTLELALGYLEQQCGIQTAEWEPCEIDLTDKEGTYVWNFEEK